MTSMLLHRLTRDFGYPVVDADGLEPFLDQAGDLVLFLTGDPEKNLETDDVAVILPELASAFPGRFAPAIVDRAIEQGLRERFDVWPTPSLLFVNGGVLRGAIAKVRDWDGYLEEIRDILSRPLPNSH